MTGRQWLGITPANWCIWSDAPRLHAMTWCWYLLEHPTGDTWIPKPWYPRKATPSFLDALAALRRTLWHERISAVTAARTPEDHKTRITDALLDTLAYAA